MTHKTNWTNFGPNSPLKLLPQRAPTVRVFQKCPVDLNIIIGEGKLNIWINLIYFYDL